MKLLEIIRIGFLPGKVVTACLQLMVCSNLPEKIDLFYKQKDFTTCSKVVCTCMCDGSDSCSGKTKSKQKQKKLWGPASLSAAWLPWLNEFAWCVFLLWRHQCIMGCYQNSLLLGINLLIICLKIVCVCVCVCMLSSLWLFCDPVGWSPPGSSVRGISQARIPEWVAISFSRGIFLKGLSPQLLYFLHWHVDSLPLCHLESPLKDFLSVLIA